MITCPNCAYQNPDNAAQCDACCGPLPVTIACPSCGALSQADAHFCGHCGAQLAVTEQGEASRPDPKVDLDGIPSPSETPQAAAYLQHITATTIIELPPQLRVIHIGKPNDRIPPDIDVSGFPHSEVVSRIHAIICVEENEYLIEDVGSANGTYVNNLPVTAGSRQRLKDGDRIAFGKEDKVAFLFKQLLDK